MKQILILLLLIIFSCSVLQAQREIARSTLYFPNNSFFESDSWADEEGYLLVRFKFSSHLNAFRFLHRERGELSSFSETITMSDILGYTSTEQEFTLYFKGFALNKKGYYFLTFFKNSNRAPVLNAWIDKAVQGDYLFSYSAFGKLYIFREEDKELTLVEVTDYGKSRMISVQNSKEHLKALKLNKWKFEIESNSYVKVNKNDRNLLFYKDSVLLLSHESDDHFKPFTRITKLDYVTGKLSSRQIVSPLVSAIASNITGDRFYQLRFGTNLKDFIELAIYQYPSLKLLNTLTYKDGENIAIKTTPLIREGGKNKEDNWSDENRDKKVMHELLKGKPAISVQRDSATVKLFIESKIVVSHSSYNPYGAGGGGTMTSYSSFYWVCFDACLNVDGTSCSNASASAYYRAAESYNKLRDEKLSGDVSTDESAGYVYNIHYTGKTREYFVEEFKK